MTHDFTEDELNVILEDLDVAYHTYRLASEIRHERYGNEWRDDVSAAYDTRLLKRKIRTMIQKGEYQ